MRRSPAAPDLEILALDGSPLTVATSTSGRSRRRHAPVAVIVVVLAIVGLAVPGRIQVAAAELRRLDQVWSDFSADEAGHQAAIGSVRAAALPADAVLVNQAILRLDQEESDRLQVLDRRLAGAVLIDGGLGRLRTALRAIIQLRLAALLDAEAIRTRSQRGPIQAVETWQAPVTAIAQVVVLLSTEVSRFRVTRVAASARIQRYNAADGALEAMNSDVRAARAASDSLALTRSRRSRHQVLPA